MGIIDKTLLIAEVELLLNDISFKQPEKESLEWYLRNNLINYLENLKNIENPSDLKISTRILSRFCIESMDWDTPLFKRCTKITELGLKIVKNS